MSKDARNEDLDLSPAMKKRFDELVALLAQQGFGEEGPPLETTFAQIEQFGHQAGRMVARRIDAHLAAQHAEHFTREQPCPTCNENIRRKQVRMRCLCTLLTVRSRFTNRVAAARLAVEIFSPQRIPLRIDGGLASPAVLAKKVLAAAYAPSYAVGELLLRKIGGLDLKSLLPGVGEEEATEGQTAIAAKEKSAEDWRPERLFRTCLSSLTSSNAFGRMMEVEADARGFYHAQKKAFVCDGLRRFNNDTFATSHRSSTSSMSSSDFMKQPAVCTTM